MSFCAFGIAVMLNGFFRALSNSHTILVLLCAFATLSLGAVYDYSRRKNGRQS